MARCFGPGDLPADAPENNPVTDEQKHAFARRIGFPHAVILPRTLYDRAKAAGYDMRVYVISKPMPRGAR